MDGRRETGPIGAPRAEGKPRYWTDGQTWDRSGFRDRGKAVLPGRIDGLGRDGPGLLYRTRSGVRAARDPGSHRCYWGTHGPSGLGKLVSRVIGKPVSRERRVGAAGSGGAGTDRRVERERDRDRDRDPAGGVQPCVGWRSASRRGFSMSLAAAATAPGPRAATGSDPGPARPRVSWNREEGESRLPTEAPGSVPGSRSSRRRDTGVLASVAARVTPTRPGPL